MDLDITWLTYPENYYTSRKTMPKKKPGKPIRLVVVLADIHVGSSRGLLTPGFITTNENGVGLNQLQEWLWECWKDKDDFIREVAGNDPYAVVLNGDLIEGIHHGTKEVWTPHVKDMVKAAIELLQPVTERAAKTFVIKGTECHTNDQEHVIAEVLGAVANTEVGLTGGGKPISWAFDRLTLDINGVRNVFRHHIGTSVRRNLAATQLSTNLVEEQIEAVNNGEPMPRVICCAHRHKYGYYQDDNGMLVVSPPWQGLTRFAHKVVSQARTKPGVFILDYRDKQPGELPTMRKRLYETPAPEAIEL